MEEVREVAEEVVAILTGAAVEDEHAAGAADRRRRLRDELFGEIEIEVGYAHFIDFSVRRGGAAGSGTRRWRRRGRALIERQPDRPAQARPSRR
jgi:hypothetical protein